MLFNSYPFLVYLVLVLAAYRVARQDEATRTWYLVLVSLVYYAWWRPPDLALLVASVILNWAAAQAYFISRRPAWRWGAIAANLAVLGVSNTGTSSPPISTSPAWRSPRPTGGCRSASASSPSTT